jgi:hypothetical protein
MMLPHHRESATALLIVDCGLRIADCGLRNAVFNLGWKAGAPE